MGDTNKGKPQEAQNDFGLPKQLIQNLVEHTVGGFVLFYFHPENGYPQHILSFDSPAHALAAHKYISDYSQAMNEVYIDGARENIEQIYGNGEEDEDDEK